MREEALGLLNKALDVMGPYHPYACALSQLAFHLDRTGSLIEVAVSAGFTPSEAVGIMDGWDSASHGYAGWEHSSGIRVPTSLLDPSVKDGESFVPKVHDEYWTGRAVGKASYERQYGVSP